MITLNVGFFILYLGAMGPLISDYIRRLIQLHVLQLSGEFCFCSGRHLVR